MSSYAEQHPGKPAPHKVGRPSQDRLDPRRGLPRPPMFWTLDQIAAMLNLSSDLLSKSYVWFEGKDVGIYRRRYLRAVNLAVGRTRDNGKAQDWRVQEGELLRWLTVNGLWIYDPDVALENYDYDRGLQFRKHLKVEPVTPGATQVVLTLSDDDRPRLGQNEEDPHGG